VTELWVTLGGRFPLIRAREGALAPAHSHMRVQETKALLKTVESNPYALGPLSERWSRISVTVRSRVGRSAKKNGNRPLVPPCTGFGDLRSQAL
jgi:hypothetical protein